MPNRLPPLSLSAPLPLNLPSATAEGFRTVNRLTLSVLRTLERSECVEPCGGTGDADDPASVRRALLFTLERLGYLPNHRGDAFPKSERAALELLRDALPTDPASLALIFTIRALSATCPAKAQEEIETALHWAGRAAFSAL